MVRSPEMSCQLLPFEFSFFVLAFIRSVCEVHLPAYAYCAIMIATLYFAHLIKRLLDQAYL